MVVSGEWVGGGLVLVGGEGDAPAGELVSR